MANIVSGKRKQPLQGVAAGPSWGPVELHWVTSSWDTFQKRHTFCREGGNDGSDIFSLSTIWYIKI